MKKIPTLLIPIFLGNPFQGYTRNILQEYYLNDSCIETVEKDISRNFYVRDILGQVVSFDINHTQDNNEKNEVYNSEGRSSATHPQNVADFQQAGIPIDPLHNPDRKPDNVQNWKWNRSKSKWIINGERRVKVGNKIITEREWQSMLINNSGQI